MDSPKTPPPKLTIVSSTPGKDDAPTPNESKQALGVSQFPRFRDHTTEQSERSPVIAPGGPVPPKKPLT